MRPAISGRGARFPQSPIRKLHELAQEARARGATVHGLNIGQPDMATPREFVDALAGYRPDVIAYSPSRGEGAMLEALLHYFGTLGVSLSAEDVLVTTGGSEALLFAFQIVAEPGDEILVPEPLYTNYRTFAMMAGLTMRPLQTRIEDGFRLPPAEAWEEAMGPRTRALLICNPSNPTGAVYAPEALADLARLARERGLFVIADEVYREFVFDGLSPSTLLTMPGLEDHLIVVDSVSKRYSLCGARVGWLVSRNRDVMRAALHLGQGRLSPPTLGQVVATRARILGNGPVEAMRHEYQRRRDVCLDELSRVSGVLVPRPAGAFYLMARLPVDDADRFATWLLAGFLDLPGEGKESLALAPGAGFYLTQGRGVDEVRVAYVLECDALRRSMRVLARALALYPGAGRAA